MSKYFQLVNVTVMPIIIFEDKKVQNGKRERYFSSKYCKGNINEITVKKVSFL